MVKILLINSSPRKYGGCYKLLVAARKGVLDAGGEAEVIHLVDYNIGPCIGCVSDDQMACRFPCVLRDDFNRVGEKILVAEGLVIATPIYWYGVSGYVKNLIDRMTSFENMIFHTGKSLVDGKVAGFIAVGNDTGAIMAIAYMMSVLNSMGIHIPPWALAYHHSMDDVLENRSALLDAYNVGYNVALAAKHVPRVDKWYRVDVDADMLREEAAKEAHVLEEEQRRKREEIFYSKKGR